MICCGNRLHIAVLLWQSFPFMIFQVKRTQSHLKQNQLTSASVLKAVYYWLLVCLSATLLILIKLLMHPTASENCLKVLHLTFVF